MELRLAVCPDRHDNFASLRAILSQLRNYAQPEHRAALTKIDDYLHEVSPEGKADHDPTHGGLLTDSVAFAIMRRISRESVYTARVIDLSARMMNAILSQIPSCKQVHVDHIDRLDRPTLKVLARAMLLLQPEHKFSWVWHSESDPTASGPDGDNDIFLASRNKLLRQLVSILSPMLEHHGNGQPLTRPEAEPRKVSTYDVSAALVMQNYDACFLWCDRLVRSNIDTEVAEGLRLMGLAAVNVGKVEEALHALRLAEEMATTPGRRAHLCYLQGLIEAKRSYDLSSSADHYERGLVTLEEDGPEVEDLPLERAWLYNGIALNEALLWRRNPVATEHYARAFGLVRDAFGLVRDGGHAARIYLRFNLLANSAFLMEMQGNYDLAIDIFSKTFDFGLDRSLTEKRDGSSALNYRIGTLHYRARRLDEASRLLQDAAQQDTATENWATQERILRALGTIALDRGAFAEAATVFNSGLEICRNSRSAEGTREHGRGLITAFLLDGKAQRARDVYETLSTEEGLTVIPAGKLTPDHLDKDVRPSPPSPKLPAYIPEVDLEDIPITDINRFLGNAPSQDSPRVVHWRS